MDRTECLSREALRAFQLGELPEKEAATIAAHLAGCPHCEEVAQQLDELSDPVIAALREPPPKQLHPSWRSGVPTLIPPAPPEDTPGPPPVLAGYEVLGELGRGGMGVVYKARQLRLNRLVALKMVLAGTHASSEQRRRFLAEAEVVARLAHPNIVAIHEVGQHDGVPYLALEYVEGGTLAQHLRGRRWEARAAAVLVEQLARAMQHAHEQGIVHRDLKPGNVLLSAACGLAGSASEGTAKPQAAIPKITDFGLAKQAEAAGLTTTGDVMGTPQYMAPEQARGERHVGPAADVYALGVILYEMLAGRPPFTGNTPMDVLLRVTSQEPPSLSGLRPRVPRDLATICLRCLDKTPARRYPSALALAEDLHRWLAGEPIRARRVGELERTWLWARRNRLVAGSLAALLLVLMAGIAVSTWFGLDARQKEGEALRARERAEAETERAQQAETSAKQEKAQAELRAAQLTFRLGLQRAQEGAVDRGLFLMLRAWRQTPPDAVAFRRVIRANLAGWARQLPRLRHALRVGDEVRGQPQARIFPGDPDGLTFLTSIMGGPVRCWDTTTGRPLGAPGPRPGNGDAGLSLLTGLSPDHRLLAVLSGAGSYLLDRGTGKRIAGASDQWLRHQEPEARVQPSWIRFYHLPDVAFTQSGSMVRLWDLRTGKALPVRFSLGDGESFVLTRTSDGREVALVFRTGPRQRLEVLELATGKPLDLPLPLAGGPEPCISYDGRLALALFDEDTAGRGPGAEERRFTWWDLEKGQPDSASWQPRQAITDLELVRDSLELLTRAGDERLRLYDLATGLQRGGDLHHVPRNSSVVALSRRWQGAFETTHWIAGFSCSGDGRLVFVIDPVGIARVWDTSRCRLQATVTANPRVGGRLRSPSGTGTVAAFAPDGRLAVTHPDQQFATLLDARTGALLGAPRQPHPGHAAFSPDGRFLATATHPDGRAFSVVVLRDARTGQPIGRPWPSPKLIHSLAFSPDGKTLAVGAVGATFLLDVPANTKRHHLPEETCIADLKFHPDSRRLAVVSKFGWAGVGAGLRVWDVWSGKPLGPFHPDHLREPREAPAAAWCAGRDELAAFDLGRGELSRLAADGQTVRGGPWDIGPVRLPTFRADGRRLVACTFGNTVQQWDTRDGQAIGEPMPHTSPPRLMRYSPDDKVLVVACSDGSIRLWDAESGWPLGPPLLHHSPADEMSFLDGGQTLLSVTGAGTVRAWPLPRPVGDDPDRFEAWLHARGGVRRRGEDTVQLSPEEWQRACQLLAQRWPGDDPALDEGLDNRAAWHRERALDAAEAGNERAELYHLDRLAALCPGEPELHARIARVHARLAGRLPAGPARAHEWQQAWAARKRGLGRPGEETWDRLCALEAMHRENWDEARWYLDGLVSRRRDDWLLLADRGGVHGRRGERAARDADFRAALARGGIREASFTLVVAEAWGREDRWPEVSGLLGGAMQAGQVHLEVMRVLALALLKQGDRLNHGELCRALVRAMPADFPPGGIEAVAATCVLSPEGLKDWGPLQARLQGIVRQAEGDVRRSKGGRPKEDLQARHRVYLRTHAALLHRAGRHAEAIAALEQAMKLAPNQKGDASEWVWLALAHAARDKADGREALRWLNQARQAAPRRDAGLWNAVLLEVLLDEARRATRRFQEV